ncbi:MAG: hypothetical protein NC923_06605 [Candidatus Omnitrophica bacterium]|nr:hypothetical protein [Candidatus Omnitrophota bacterium]
MGLDFRIKDFAYPISIIRLKNQFERNQWISEDALRAYQQKRLRLIIEHAYRNVPYYRRIFQEKNIIPSDIKSINELKIMPFLTKEIIQKKFNELIAVNAKKYKPRLLSTSGTSGGAVKFYVDKPSNILEFVYYWRFWGWAGYRLGNTFAELSAQSFTPYSQKKEQYYYFEFFTRRLMVNSLLISYKNSDNYIRLFKKFKPRFLKGLPSNLYALARIIGKKTGHGITFRAIFSQGENLLRYQRDYIENTFSCKVFDSYGHMERTVAISQCPFDSYHVHMDYGGVEFVEPVSVKSEDGIADGQIREVVGTSLYNFAMPLIRYRTGDYIRLKPTAQKCSCNRTFPIVGSIVGRNSDIVITPDGRAITALYVVFDRTPNICFGQVIQERLDKLLVKVAYNSQDIDSSDALLLKNLVDFVGDSMKIEIVHIGPEELEMNKLVKNKTIISKISSEQVIRQEKLCVV